MPTKHTFSSVAAPIEKPLPLWILYPLFFVGIYLSHWSLLRLPFFWDEAGYYVPAALDYFQTGSLIPHSTISNAHPPLPSIFLAEWWQIAGYVISGTRTFIAMVAAAALLGVFRIARLLAGTPVAIAVTVLTAIYPVWFAQSTLAHADIFAAAFSLWALSFYLERYTSQAPPRNRTLFAVALLFSLAALSKETAIVTPVSLALWEAVLLLTERKSANPYITARWFATLLAPILPLSLWYAYHYHHTGYVFGNPEFLRYNATANLSFGRVLISLWHRASHLTIHMNMYVPIIATVAVLFMPRTPSSKGSPATHKPALTALAVIVAGNAIAFSILGGALLTRYLLPLYPLILLACIALWRERFRQWPWLAVLTAAGFITALFINPPYGFAPEDNLTYRDFIVLHQQAIKLIETRYPYATVLTAWPGVTELAHPELGYTKRPLKVDPVDNFSLDQMQKAAADPGAYDTAFLFSTKWVPSAGRVNLARASESTDTRLYDFHRDLSPTEIAYLLHGDIVWQAQRHGEWAAILRFPRSVEATLYQPQPNRAHTPNHPKHL